MIQQTIEYTDVDKGDDDMGWTSYHATHYKNGKIDRKAECDDMWNYDNNGKFTVLKSSMKGSTYYGAIKQNNTGEVFAVIFLTSTDMRDYFNFYYKDMDETMGPYQCDCPKGILDLLTPTDNEMANAWRKSCYERLKAKKSPNTLGKLPVGTVIKFNYNGEERTAYKHPAAYQFKRPFWMMQDKHLYVKQKHIPENYIVVKRGEQI